MASIIEVALTVMVPFGSLLWLTTFLNTYKHFPKMEKKSKIAMGILNATLITFAVVGIVSLVLFLAVRNLF